MTDGGPRLSLELFGGVRASLADGASATFANRKVGLLAAYLGTGSGTRFDRRIVARAVWPDATPDAAMASLRNALSLLKKDLKDLGIDPDTVVSADRTDVWFELGACRSDVQRFLCLATEGQEAAVRLEEAVEFEPWRFCEGYSEPWVIAKRSELAAVHDEAVDRLIRLLTAAGQSGRAADVAARASDQDPDSEKKLQTALQALTAAGRGPEALGRYRTFEKSLRTRLGVPPSDQTVGLAREARRRAVHRKRLAPSNLPATLPPIFGRAELTDRLVDGLCGTGGKARILTLYGPGGVGKTRLALEVAKTASKSYSKNTWFVDCSSLKDPAGLPERIWNALGREEGDRPAVGFDAFLSGGRGLLVLDNLEQIVPNPGPLVQALVEAEPGLDVVATTRESLGVEDETLVRVSTLEVPSGCGPIEDSPSVRLYVDRARLVVPGFEVDDPASVSELVKRLDGLPLAICLAAAHADLFSPAETLSRLDKRFDLLQEDSEERPDRHRRLWACIDWSHSMHPEIHDTLRCLSVFRGGWTVQTAEWARPEPGTASHLQAALRASLVQAVARGSSVRFEMLESIREFLQAGAGAEGIADARRRYAAAMRAWALDLRAQTLDFNQQYLESRALEYDNFREVMDWCLEYEPEWALDFIGTFAYYWYSRDMHREGESWIRKAIAANGPDGSGRLANAYRALSTLYVGLTRYDEAVEALSAGMALLPADAGPYEHGRFLNSKGNALMQAHKYAEAKEAFRQAHEDCVLAGDGQLGMAVRLNMGFALYLEGELDAAERAFGDTIDDLRNGDNDDWLANNLHNFGLVALADGRLHDAKVRLEEARKIVEARGLNPALRSWLSDAVVVAARLGEVDQARTLLRRSAAGVLESSGVGRLVECAEAAVEVALASKDLEEAVGLLAVIVGSRAERQRSAADRSPLPKERLQSLRDQLSKECFAQAKERYRGWSLVEVLELIASSDEEE